LQLTLSLFFAINIEDKILSTIWPSVIAFALFVSETPEAFKYFAIRVEKSAFSVAFIVFELPVIDLAISPIVPTESVFLARFPVAFVDPAVSPHVEAISVHGVVLEAALEGVPVGGDAPPEAVALPVCEEALVDGAVREDLEALSVWPVLPVHLPPVQVSAPPSLELVDERALLLLELLALLLGEVEGAEGLVGGLDVLEVVVLEDVGVVVERELVCGQEAYGLGPS